MTNKERIYSQNINQFKQLVSFVASLGRNYLADNKTLELPNLKIVLNDAELSLKELRADSINLENAALARENAFEDLQQTIISLNQTLGEISESLARDQNINFLIEKLTGKSFISAIENAPDRDKSHPKPAFTFSQLSYETQIVFFERLVRILNSQADYQPDEYDLAISSLRTRLADLREKNAEAVTAATVLSSSRMIADEVFCDAETGLINIAEIIKQNIRVAFGADSPEYSEVKNLKFEKI